MLQQRAQHASMQKIQASRAMQVAALESAPATLRVGSNNMQYGYKCGNRQQINVGAGDFLY